MFRLEDNADVSMENLPFHAFTDIKSREIDTRKFRTWKEFSRWCVGESWDIREAWDVFDPEVHESSWQDFEHIIHMQTPNMPEIFMALCIFHDIVRVESDEFIPTIIQVEKGDLGKYKHLSEYVTSRLDLVTYFDNIGMEFISMEDDVKITAYAPTEESYAKFKSLNG